MPHTCTAASVSDVLTVHNAVSVAGNTDYHAFSRGLLLVEFGFKPQWMLLCACMPVLNNNMTAMSNNFAVVAVIGHR